MLFALINAAINASGALFGSTVDAEMQGCSGERRERKIDDDAAPKLYRKLCKTENQQLLIRVKKIGL